MFRHNYATRPVRSTQSYSPTELIVPFLHEELKYIHPVPGKSLGEGIAQWSRNSASESQRRVEHHIFTKASERLQMLIPLPMIWIPIVGASSKGYAKQILTETIK